LIDVTKSSTRSTSISVGLLNAQSLGNKAASVNDCIVDNRLDLLAVVESWHDSFETSNVIAATPVNYRVIERARPCSDATDASLVHNHGGICIFVRSHLKIKLLDFPLYRSFQLLPLYILNPAIKSLFLVVYRPGSKPPTSEFVEEFSDVLEHSSSYAQCTVVGDVNVHLDDPTAPQVSPFLDLLSNFGLSEWVRQPTHSLGHQLDVLITRTDQPVSAVRVDPPLLLSDHSLITAMFAGPGQPVVSYRPWVQCRCWKRINDDAFTADLLDSDLVVSPPVDVSELFNCYNTTLTRLVDLHAPVIAVMSYSPPTAPWFDRD